jgi:hypothetical protein
MTNWHRWFTVTWLLTWGAAIVGAAWLIGLFILHLMGVFV